MTEITESGTLETWSTASCPFTIEYSRRVLDDIRLAVVDAFFSLPRGGAEIGGVLLGRFTNERVTIVEHAPLECEHIFGPSFTLSPGDHARLAEMLDAIRNHMSDVQPIGWYHSHTRSDIFLSEADLDLYNRYFPDPWQVALVLRPTTFQPVQAGFFFREQDGSVHTRASYQEFALDPLPVGQVPHGMPVPMPQPAHWTPEPEGQVITLMADPAAAPAEPQHWEHVAVPAAPMEAAFAPAAESAPPPRTVPLPPALPPLPTLELVPEPSRPEAYQSEPYYSEPYQPEQHQPEAYHPESYRNDEPVLDQPWAVEVAPAPEEAETPLAVEAPAALVEPEAPVSLTPPTPAESHADPQPEIEPALAAETKPAPRLEPQTERPAAEPPNFLQMEPVRPRRRLWVAGIAAVAVALGAGGYQQRANWLPQVTQMLPQRAGAPTVSAPLTLPLSASDQQGQLQIRWNGTARAITQARDAIFQITDDGATTDLPLDAAHLQGGEFTYARHGEHVDARLTIQELDGTQVRAVTSFYGPMPAPGTAAAADPSLRKQDSDLAKENAGLRERLDELSKQTAKLMAEVATRPEPGKPNADLTRQIAELRQQRDDLAKQAAKLKSDLAARAEAGKQNADLTRQVAELRQQRDDLAKQAAKLKSDLAARAAPGKQSPDLARQNAELRQQRDDLAKQAAKLKSDLAARAEPGKQSPDLARQNGELRQQRDDLLIQTAKLKADLAARGGGSAQNLNPQQSTDLSKQRYALINQVSRLESDLAVATARADRLARQIEEMRKQQLQQRLQNQSGEPTQ